MNMKYLNILLITIALLASCDTKYVDLDELDATEKLVLYCMPAAGVDTTLIQLSRSVPVTSSSLKKKELGDATIHYMVNGVEQEVKYTEKKIGSVPKKSYYVVGALHAGDKVSVEASVDGLPAVSGSTTIPASFPFNRIELALKNALYSYSLQFRVVMNGEADLDYYAVHYMLRDTRIYKTNDISGNDKEDVKSLDHHLDMDISEEPLLNNATGADEIFDVSNSYFRNLYIFTNRTFRGNDYTLRTSVPYSSNIYEDYYTHKMYYKVYMYRLSPEMYRYVKSVNDVNNNDLGESGLAPVRSHYSNVSGGLGVVCGCNITDTGWIDNPDKFDGDDNIAIYTHTLSR